MATTASDGLAQLVDDRIIYGHSTIMQSLNAMVAEIAKTDIPILLTGETGTGKEVYARLIHRVSVLGGASLKMVCTNWMPHVRKYYFHCCRTGNQKVGAARRRCDLFPRHRATWKRKSKEGVFAGNCISE